MALKAISVIDAENYFYAISRIWEKLHEKSSTALSSILPTAFCSVPATAVKAKQQKGPHIGVNLPSEENQQCLYVEGLRAAQGGVVQKTS